MSTQDCKKLILTLSEEYALDPKIKWKRASKRKEGEGSLRVFVNDKNDTEIVIYENKNGEVSLHEISLDNEPSTAPPDLSDKIGSYKELCSFIFADLVLKNVMESLKHYEKTFQEDFPEFVKTANEVWKTTGGKVSEILESDMLEFLENKDFNFFSSFMLEEPAANMTGKEFSAYLFRVSDIEQADFFKPMLSENIDVEYDMENVWPAFCIDEKSNIAFLIVSTGGDWETPVSIYFYLNKETNRAEGFFDFGNENMYNVKNKAAYGNDDDDDASIEKEEKKQEYIEENEEKIQKKMQKKFISEIIKKFTVVKKPSLKM